MNYDKQAQHEWISTEPKTKTDWPLIICTVLFCMFGFVLLDAIAADIASWRLM